MSNKYLKRSVKIIETRSISKVLSRTVNYKSNLKIIGFLFVLPTFFYFIAIYYIPLIKSLTIAFQAGSPVSLKFVGLESFKRVFSDPEFWRVAKQTLSFTVMSVLLIVLGSIIISIAIDQIKLKFLRNIFIVFFLSPSLMSFVAAGLIWSWILDPNFGLLNSLFTMFGLQTSLFLSNPSTVLFWLAIIQAWVRMGFSVLIITSALKGIPNRLYEAAAIDGANFFQVHFKITLPLLLPTIGVVSILETISSSKVFGLIAVTTQGGPAGCSQSLMTYLYDEAFKYFRFGRSAVVSLFLFVILLTLSIIQFKAFKGGK